MARRDVLTKAPGSDAKSERVKLKDQFLFHQMHLSQIRAVGSFAIIKQVLDPPTPCASPSTPKPWTRVIVRQTSLRKPCLTDAATAATKGGSRDDCSSIVLMLDTRVRALSVAPTTSDEAPIKREIQT
jgi:hypothetical protein